MVYDFQQTCKTYDKNIYDREYFKATHCPACPAVGRFKMHGTYWRYAVYFDDDKLKCEHMEIKRVICASCRTTHAVLPGDIIPYKLLTLYVVLFIICLFYLDGTPVLKIAEACKFSHQFIYSAISAFLMHASRIYMYFRETTRGAIGHGLGKAGIAALIKKPYIEFQSGYTGIYRRPCFMCKFFDRAGAPPVGIHAP